MGKIMKDGISYSGSTYTGGTDIEITGANVINAKVRELTQAQYDALSSAEKNNGTTYYITDGIPSVIGVTDVKANGTSIVSNHVANIPLVSSANNGLVPQGSSVTTQSQTTKFLREDGSWATPSYTSVSDKANIDGSNIANPSAFRSAIGIDGALTGTTIKSGTIANGTSATIPIGSTVGLVIIYRPDTGLYSVVSLYGNSKQTILGTLPSTITISMNTSTNSITINNSVGYTIPLTIIANAYNAL